MTFVEAIKITVEEGRRVARTGWEDKLSYISVNSGFLTIRMNGVFHAWMITRDDMEADDWIEWSAGSA